MSEVRRRPHSVVPGAVTVAGTGQDHHDRPPGGFTVDALEVHQGRLGSVGGAASAVCAGPAVTWCVGLDARAVLVGEVCGRPAPHQPLALAASLQVKKVGNSFFLMMKILTQ